MKQINALTGLRGIAAYSVVLAHSINTAFTYSGVIVSQEFAQRLAYFGMALFFVLSGFVIHYNYAKLIQSEGFLMGGYKFLVARLARLYPLYALMLFFTLDSLPSAIFHDRPWAAISFLTMTQSWFNLEMLDFPPAWSISTEWFFYFAFLLMIPLFEKIKKPLLVLGIFLIGIFFLMPTIIQIQKNCFGDTQGWAGYFSPFTRIFDFIAGALTSKTYLSFNTNSRKATLIDNLAVMFLFSWCVLIIMVNPFSTTRYSILLSNFIFTPALALLLLSVCTIETLITRVLCSRLLILMGEISYSFYLLQFMIMTGVASAYVNPKATPLAYVNSSIKVVVIMTFTTFVAYGCYNMFEKPSRNWTRRLLLGKKLKEQPTLIINPSVA
jgi:peptidoglycan/LPS O-acetylase OafA/YrhL